MATETLYADAVLSGTFTTGTAALGAPNSVWTTDLEGDLSGMFGMADPVGVPSGVQTFAVRARKGGGTSNPSVSAVNVYSGGVLVGTVVGSTTVSSTAGVTLTGNVDGALLTDPASVQVEVVTVGGAGKPSARSAIQLDGITWTANTVAAPAPVLKGGGTGAVTITGTAGGRTTRRGSGTGALNITGTARGTTTRRGSGAGLLSVTGTAGGSAPTTAPATGRGTGLITVTGTAGGKAPTLATRSGSGSGLVTITGTAGGTAPAAAAKRGGGQGLLSVTGTARGTTVRKGTGRGVLTITGTAGGVHPSSGSGTGGVVTGGTGSGTGGSTGKRRPPVRNPKAELAGDNRHRAEPAPSTTATAALV